LRIQDCPVQFSELPPAFLIELDHLALSFAFFLLATQL
jgi:hypothetical protein